MTNNAPGLTGQQCRSNVDDETLRQVKLYIDRFARAFISVTFTEDDVEDLVQNSWIKFWKACPREVISLKNYVRQLVHHEFVSMLRQRKRFLRLKTMEDGEYAYAQEAVMIERSEEMDDPQEVLQRQWDGEECMRQVMNVVRVLPQRQQFAIRCSLYQRVDNLVVLIDAFNRYQVNGEIRWPSAQVDKQRLQASCAPARAKIARHLKLNIR